MLTRRLWQINGESDTVNIGCISDEPRILSRIETALGFVVPEDRLKEDLLIVDEEQDMYALSILNQTGDATTTDASLKARPITRNEVEAHLDSKFPSGYPDQLESQMESVDSELYGVTYEDEDFKIFILRLGPANLLKV